MPRKVRQVFADSEILRERALRCRQLADGVGNLRFAIRLTELSQEYEGLAGLKESKAKTLPRASVDDSKA